MLKIKNLQKTYNNVQVIDIPELSISKGECLGLVGNNGAGKTTLFRLILDLVRPDKGEVFIGNQKVIKNDNWKSITGSFLDESFLIDFLTPEEYFTFVGKLHHKSKEEIDNFMELMSDFFNGEILETKKLLREFSKGNQKKIGIAAALIGDPALIILDEPFTGLDPSSQIRLKRFIVELQAHRNTTILISSHYLNHVTEVCQRIVVLEKGNIVKDLQKTDDTLKDLKEYFEVLS